MARSMSSIALWLTGKRQTAHAIALNGTVFQTQRTIPGSHPSTSLLTCDNVFMLLRLPSLLDVKPVDEHVAA